MAHHYRAKGKNAVYQTLDVPESNFDLVCALRKTQGIAENIQRVLHAYQHITTSALRDSLLELSTTTDHAEIAFIAGQMSNLQCVVNRAAAIILASNQFSQQLKDNVRPYMTGKGPIAAKLSIGNTRIVRKPPLPRK